MKVTKNSNHRIEKSEKKSSNACKNKTYQTNSKARVVIRKKEHCYSGRMGSYREKETIKFERESEEVEPTESPGQENG